MTFKDTALASALADRAIYRTMAHAALDNLHEATITIDKQREQIAALREEIARYTAGQVQR